VLRQKIDEVVCDPCNFFLLSILETTFSEKIVATREGKKRRNNHQESLAREQNSQQLGSLAREA
jgi:hypothetical protein